MQRRIVQWCGLTLILPSLALAGQLGQGAGSNYPAALDTKTTFTDKVACNTTISTRICAATPNDLQAAIVSIETELGLLPKGSYATVVARLNAGVYIGTAGANLTAAAGGLVYSTPTSLDVQAAGTSGYFARSGGTGAPAWFDLFGTANTFTTVQTISADNVATSPFQVTIKGTTDGNRQLLLGYNTTSNYGSIQAIHQGISVTPLALQASGGNVGIGTTNPNVGLEMGATLDVRIPNIKSTTGVRYVCVNTLGTLTSQAAACAGT